jgi:hypothetical protein
VDLRIGQETVEKNVLPQRGIEQLLLTRPTRNLFTILTELISYTGHLYDSSDDSLLTLFKTKDDAEILKQSELICVIMVQRAFSSLTQPL